MDRLKDWIYYNSTILGCVLTVSIFLVLYVTFTKSNRNIDFKDFTEEVEVISFQFEKINALPEFYATEQKLDKVSFEVTYKYLNETYQSKSSIYWEYVTPRLSKILETNQLDKLKVRCAKVDPNKIMIFTE